MKTQITLNDEEIRNAVELFLQGKTEFVVLKVGEVDVSPRFVGIYDTPAGYSVSVKVDVDLK